MTVVNMISFGDEGVAVADEQSSTTIRKYNVSQKLQLLNNSFVYGGSGPADLIKEIYGTLSEQIVVFKKDKDKISLNDAYHLCQKTLIDYKNQLKNQVLSVNLGIGLDDMLTGVLSRNGKKLDESAMQAGRNIMQHLDENTRMDIILGGLRDDKFEIYIIDTSYAGAAIARPYSSIGSGADESDKVLSRYVTSLPREKRDKIDKKEGLIKIIEATNASSNLNVGVGGVPSIVSISKDGIKRPDEQKCILASEIVEGLTNNILDKDFAYDAVSRLVFNNEDFEKIEEEMQKKASSWKKLDRILRGYKE